MAAFVLQLGIDAVQFNTPTLNKSLGYWTYEESFRELKVGCEKYGLTLQALENVPPEFVTDVKFRGTRGAVAELLPHNREHGSGRNSGTGL